jgi:Flp pilus assembly protein TadD
VAAVQARGRALHLVLKLHPSAPAGEETRVARLAAEAGARPALVLRDRLTEVLVASDVLVTLPSTIAVEAMIVGTPVVATEFFYEGEAIVTVAAERDAIAAALHEILARGTASAEFAARRRAFLARYNGPCDGRAAERVAALVAHLAERARPAAAAAPPGERVGAARGLLRGGNAAGALALLETASGAEADVVRGDALVRLGRAAEAERAFRSALAAGAGAPALAGLGLLLLERGAHREAETRLTQAAALDATSDWAWCGLGVLAALRGDGAGAIERLERALRLNPANPDARSALAVLRGDGARGIGDAA